ncbi:MAG: GPP34 family phosphoprotein [Actinocatenispora sp.]
MTLYSGGRHEPEPEPAPYDRSTARLPLPEALYVLGHDEQGRPRYHPTILAMVVAGGLLAELTISGVLVLADATPRVVADPHGQRELVRAAADTIRADPGVSTLDVWLPRFAEEAVVRAGDALEEAGLCQRQRTRRLGILRSSRVVFTDRSLLSRTEAWFNSALIWSEQPDRTDAVLASLGRELGAVPPAYTDLTADGRRRRRQFLADSMDEGLRRIVSATHRAIANAALGAYR